MSEEGPFERIKPLPPVPSQKETDVVMALRSLNKVVHNFLFGLIPSTELSAAQKQAQYALDTYDRKETP